MGIIVGCVGYATPASDITNTSARLHALASCSANTTTNPCTAWFQYWRDGSSFINETSHTVANVAIANYDFSQTIAGLSPGMLYRYQFCGYGDTNIPAPGFCVGPGGFNAPGTQPNPDDLSATSNFRTASSTTRATIDLGRVLSTADTAQNPITRDAGISVQYSSSPLRALWIFADSVQIIDDDPNGPPDIYISFTGTAAAGTFSPGMAPNALEELPTPPAPPQPGLDSIRPFLPTPVGLKRPNGTNCSGSNSFAAAWIKGAAKVPSSSSVLLVYSEVCVEVIGSNEFTFTHERLALVEYNPFSNVLGTVSYPLEASPLESGLGPKKRLQSPVFGNDGYLYLFAGRCNGPGEYDGSNCSSAGAIYLARVPANPTSWSKAGPYRWWDGQGWGSAINATNIIPGAAPIFRNVSVHDFSSTTSKKYVLIEQTGFRTGMFKTHHATSITGPWTPGPSGQVPDNCNDGGAGIGCYAIYGHPELSSATQLVFSWLSPRDPEDGHVRVGAMPW